MQQIRNNVAVVLLVSVVAACGAATAATSSGPPTASPAATSGPTATPRESAPASPAPSPSPVFEDPYDLVVGMCVDPILDHGDDTLLAGLIRSCKEPHLMEVFGVGDLAATPDGLYPGDATVDEMAWTLCEGAFLEFVGVDFDRSRLSASYWTPTDVTWSAGDRSVLCVVEAHPYQPLVASVKGSKR